MKQWMGMVWLLIAPGWVWAAQVLHTEVYPKPVKVGQQAYFRIRVENAGSRIEPETVEIFVAGHPLGAKYIGKLETSSNLTDYCFTATAPRDFDWRQVQVRLNGQDYPAGPDDPYMICDAPFRVKSAQATIPLSVAFHDADNDDVQLQFVEVFNDATNEFVTSYPVWEWISTPFRSYLFDGLNGGNFGADVGDTAWITVVLHCDDHDWPWIPEEYTFTQHLKVRLGRELPALAGWYYGDVHTHSSYTNNLYEYGGPLEMYAAAAEAIGLSFVTISDHSSDFDASGSLFQEMTAQCATYSTPSVHLFPAEEVCLDDNEVNSSVDNRIHLLNYAESFIRGPEAPITLSLDTSDRFTFLSEALAEMEAEGGFGYAAHPFQAFDPFVALFGLAMVTWSPDNYTIAHGSSAFSGLELWNERNRYRKDVSYWYELNPFPWEDNPNWGIENSWITQGIAQWDDLLSQGLTQNFVVPCLLPQKTFISAGSDGHGDFNYRTYNVDPVFYNVYATDNAFGCLRTAVYVPGYAPGQLPPLDELMTAYRLGRSVVTDGHFLEIGIDANGDGDLDDSQDGRVGDEGILFSTQVSLSQVLVSWESSEDWGTVQNVTIYRGGSATGTNPTMVESFNPNNYSGQQSFPLTTLVSNPSEGWVYLRATATGTLLPDEARRAFTNPVWVKIETTPTASVSLDPTGLPVIIPANGGNFEYTINVTNQTATPVNCNLWLEAVLPSGSSYSLLNVPLTLAGGFTISRTKVQTVPPGAPAGDYAFRAHLGSYPTPWSSDGFMFSKLSGANASREASWANPDSDFTLDRANISEIPAVHPAAFQVRINPNPCNAEAAFKLDLPENQMITLSLYEPNGRIVRLLYQGWMESGPQEVKINTRDLPSGIYLYSLQAERGEATGKILILK